MALQGTLDTFALPDVLRLLAATQKTGRLRLTGPRGTGSISVDSGTIGIIEASAAPLAVEPVDALFELLRFEQGSFTFDADCAPAVEPGPGVGDLEALLTEAEALLREWQEIRAVVPSMDAWVTLRPSLHAATVSLERDHWQAVVAVGGGATMRQIADALSLAELPASRSVRALVELGLSEVISEAPLGSGPSRALRRAEPVVAGGEPVARAEPERFVPLDFSNRAPASPVGAAPEEQDDGEVAQQLARLSPRAADAVRNATADLTEEEPAAAVADTGHDDADPINRGLLLKFLSSVKD